MAAEDVDTAERETLRSIERVYCLWDQAHAARDVEAAVKLYAPRAVLESPLVRHILDTEAGVIEGRAALRAFLRQAFERMPASRGHYRTGLFTDGHRIIWEYPRLTPTGEQLDFVEVMEIENGLIRRHAIYWGWFGVKLLEEDRFRP